LIRGFLRKFYKGYHISLENRALIGYPGDEGDFKDLSG